MVKRLFFELIEGFIRNINGILGVKLRYHYYKCRLRKCGEKVIIDSGVYIESPENVELGSNVWIDKNVILLAGKPIGNRKIFYKNVDQNNEIIGKIKIGGNVHVAPNVLIQGHGGVQIGENSGIASGTKIYSFSHHYRDLNSKSNEQYFFTPMVEHEKQALVLSPVLIGFGTAIGLNCVILPGTTIKDYSWIGSGVVLQNRTIEPKLICYLVQQLETKEF
jgi:acetyltransferase-like isoleucine patch superfamily enzyme